MLNNLEQSIIHRIESLSGYSPSEQKELDGFMLNVIKKINDHGEADGIITISAPSDRIAQTAQYLLSSNGISSSLCKNILAIHLNH